MPKILRNIRNLKSTPISREKVFGLPREARITKGFFSEFLGKRLGKLKVIQGFSEEFLGKRNHVQKHYSEFLG